MELHEYQRVAVSHLHARPRAALFLECGLGKSAVTLSALTPDHLPALVIAPKRVVESVWTQETQLWRPDLDARLAVGKPAKRVDVLNGSGDIVCLGRDNLGDLASVTRTYRTVVLDELTSFKSRQSQRWKAARAFVKAQRTPYVWGLTGTPAPNGLIDLWPQLALVDNGASLGKTIGAYRADHFREGRRTATGIVTEWLLRAGEAPRIHARLEGVALSMRAVDHLDLPPVTFNRIGVKLPPLSRAAYDELAAGLVHEIDGQEFSSANAAVRTGRLSQIAAGFLYPDVDDLDAPPGGRALHAAKISAAVEVVDGTGSPVLVFYRFRWEFEQLRAALKGRRVADVRKPGAVSSWNAGELDVLLAHPDSAGHGLNLQRAGHTIVWTSLPWSLEAWQQANGRIARQGQPRPVVIHTVEALDTVDEVIADRLAGRANVQDALLRHLRGRAGRASRPAV